MLASTVTSQQAHAAELRKRASNLSDYLINNRDFLQESHARQIRADMNALLAEAAAIEAELSAQFDDIQFDTPDMMCERSAP